MLSDYLYEINLITYYRFTLNFLVQTKLFSKSILRNYCTELDKAWVLFRGVGGNGTGKQLKIKPSTIFNKNYIGLKAY